MAWTHTSDLSDGFFRKVKTLAANLGAKPEHLLMAWYSESIGIHADAENKKPGAAKGTGAAFGINQISPAAALKKYGWEGTAAEYLDLTAEQQLSYVENYYAPYKGKLTSVARVYQINYLPATIDTITKPTDVLVTKGGTGPLDQYYNGNESLDDPDPAKRKGYITLDDLRVAAERATAGKPRWQEILTRLNSVSATPTPGPAKLFDGWWEVTTQEGVWRYKFHRDGDVDWADADTPDVIEGTGQWTMEPGQIKMTWKMSEESWNLPIDSGQAAGTVKRSTITFQVNAKKVK
jgi:hypothetical protein